VTDVLYQTARCLLPADGKVYVGTSEARLFALEGGELTPVEEFDRVEGRGDWFTPWGGPPDTRSLSRGPDGIVYANVHVGGVVRSTDGARWEPTIDINADVHQVLAHPDRPGTVLAAGARGLSVSRDGGATWETSDRGLHGAYCRAVALAGDTVLVTASTGPFTQRAAIYRRALDGDEPFERCTDGLPEWFGSNIDTHCLAASGDVAAFAADDAAYRSTDGGRSWERVGERLPSVRAVLLA
jgi:hypothetical protein